MKLGCRKSLVIISIMAFFMSGACLSAKAATATPSYKIPSDLLPLAKKPAKLAKAWYQKIQSLRQKTRAVKAADEAGQFITWLNKKAGAKLKNEYLKPSWIAKAESHRAAGEYLQASKAYQRAYKIDPSDKEVAAKLNVTRLLKKQAEMFKKISAFVTQRENLAKKILADAKKIENFQEKIQALKKGKKSKPADIKELQDKIKTQREMIRNLKEKLGESNLRQLEVTHQYRQQGVFLSPGQKARLQPLYENTDRMLDAAYRKQNKDNGKTPDKPKVKMYGDLNNDGEIDEKDLDALEKVAYRMPINPKEEHYNAAWDLSGDGRIGMIDYVLLDQAVNGNREHFPADPKTLRGDINGDGKLTEQDIQAISWHFTRHGHRKDGYFVRSDLDVNGDGKFTLKDVLELSQKVRTDMQIDQKKADVNSDGRIDAMDLLKIMELATVKKVIADPAVFKAADLTGDGKVDALDVLAWGKSQTNLLIEDPPLLEDDPDAPLPEIPEEPEFIEVQDWGEIPDPLGQTDNTNIEIDEYSSEEIASSGEILEVVIPEVASGTEDSSDSFLDR